MLACAAQAPAQARSPQAGFPGDRGLVYSRYKGLRRIVRDVVARLDSARFACGWLEFEIASEFAKELSSGRDHAISCIGVRGEAASANCWIHGLGCQRLQEQFANRVLHRAIGTDCDRVGKHRIEPGIFEIDVQNTPETTLFQRLGIFAGSSGSRSHGVKTSQVCGEWSMPPDRPDCF
jgi:hypothetical protein